MQKYVPATMTTSRALFFLACFALSCFSGCSIHRQYLSGDVSSRIKNDTLIIKYNIHIKNPAIDSVAFQLLSTEDSLNKGLYYVHYAPEDRVEDSLYRSLGDSLPCCLDLSPSLLQAIRDGRFDTSSTRPDTSFLCWWHTLPRLFPGYDTTFDRFWIPPIPLINDILATRPLDSLRKISVPCDWACQYTPGTRYYIDTVLQADSVIFGRDSNTVKHSTRRVQNSNGSIISMRGQLRYPVTEYREPARYALKLYSEGDYEEIDPFVFLWYHEFYAYTKVWEGVIPPRPKTEVFRSAEPGNMLGMLGGIGGVKNSRFTSSSGISFAGPQYGFSLTWGAIYYTPHFIHTIDFSSLNSPTAGDSGAVNDLFSAMLGARYHPLRAVSQGSFFTAGSGYSGMATRGAGKERPRENTLDLRLGAGYETSFDRIEYAYHTAHGGYHRFDLLIGVAALAQGKAGLKCSLLTGDRIRTAALELYMENRFCRKTMTSYNSRPLFVQAALYAGMVAGWVALF